MEINDGISAKSIGEVAKELRIDTARLRDWCNKGLVEHFTKTGGARWIWLSEYEKIRKIKSIFDDGQKRGIRVTFEDVKEQLLKDDLLDNHKEEQQNEVIVKNTERALKNIGVDEVLMLLAEKFQDVPNKKDLAALVEGLKNQNQQPLQIEDLETKEKLGRLETEVKDMKEILLQTRIHQEKENEYYKQQIEREKAARQKSEDQLALIQSQLNGISKTINEAKNQENKGFWAKFFGG